jgi:hypothetical protein
MQSLLLFAKWGRDNVLSVGPTSISDEKRVLFIYYLTVAMGTLPPVAMASSYGRLQSRLQ